MSSIILRESALLLSMLSCCALSPSTASSGSTECSLSDTACNWCIQQDIDSFYTRVIYSQALPFQGQADPFRECNQLLLSFIIG